MSRKDNWQALHEELDRWAQAGRTATFWWRDDDAVDVTPALERLLTQAADHGLTIGLAVIPAQVTEALAENVVELRFVYYDVDGNPVPSTPTPPYALDSQGLGSVPDQTDVSQRSAVQRVVLTVTAEAVAPHRGTQRYTLTSDVWLRNEG